MHRIAERFYFSTLLKTAGEVQSLMMQGTTESYLARVGSWVEEPESGGLKLHLDAKNKQQQIKIGTEKKPLEIQTGQC